MVYMQSVAINLVSKQVVADKFFTIKITRNDKNNKNHVHAKSATIK